MEISLSHLWLKHWSTLKCDFSFPYSLRPIDLKVHHAFDWSCFVPQEKHELYFSSELDEEGNCCCAWCGT